MLDRWSVKRQLLLVASLATLAVALALAFGGALVYRYDHYVSQLKQEELGEIKRWSDVQNDLARVHSAFVDLVYGAQSLDEQKIYLQGRALTSRIDALAARVGALSAENVRAVRIMEEMSKYRASSLMAVEMLTVNPALSGRYGLQAALGQTELSLRISSHFDIHRRDIEQQVQQRFEEIRRAAWIAAIGLILLACTILGLIGRITRNLSAHFGYISDTLRDLSDGTRQVTIDRPASNTELGLVVGGLLKFQQALAERDFSQRQTKAIFDSILEAVVVIDERGRIIETNPVTCQLFGYAADELPGQNVSILMPGDHASGHDGYLQAYLRTGQGSIVGNIREVTARHRDGHALPIQLAVSRVDVGERIYFVGVIVDIRDRVERERQLGMARDQALDASRLKSEFLANMSHEIRTPMNSIIGMTDLAMDARDDDERREYLQIVKSSADSLLTIINDILDFSKIESGKLSIEQIAFGLRRTVTDAIRTFEFLAREKHLELACDIADDVPAFVIGDPVRLRQILINLVGNAIKFTQNGSVSLSLGVDALSSDAVMLRFAVRDTGVGIPEDRIANIFSAFSQADASTTRKFGGTGLGLSICRRLIELMDGHLRVESRPGHGSTFSFELPLRVAAADDAGDATAAVDAPTDPAGMPTRQPSGPLDILLVEDTPFNQLLAVKLLEKWGHRVAVTGDGQQAVDRIASGGQFDLVLMDLQMPVMDGLEATRRIRAIERERGQARLKIIAMTANAMSGDRDACLAAGMDDYLSKPISKAELSEKLQLHAR